MSLPVYFTQYHAECRVYYIVDRIQGKPLDGYYFLTKEEAEKDAKNLNAMLYEAPEAHPLATKSKSLPSLPNA